MQTQASHNTARPALKGWIMCCGRGGLGTLWSKKKFMWLRFQADNLADPGEVFTFLEVMLHFMLLLIEPPAMLQELVLCINTINIGAEAESILMMATFRATGQRNWT
jgi:hypothetical protein